MFAWGALVAFAAPGVPVPFVAACLRDDTSDQSKIERFCEELRPGDPPEGQEYLRRAFDSTG